MTTQPENNENAEPKISKDELSEKELEKAAGGNVSLSYGKVQVTYKEQTSDGGTPPKSP